MYFYISVYKFTHMYPAFPHSSHLCVNTYIHQRHMGLYCVSLCPSLRLSACLPACLSVCLHVWCPQNSQRPNNERFLHISYHWTLGVALGLNLPSEAFPRVAGRPFFQVENLRAVFKIQSRGPRQETLQNPKPRHPRKKWGCVPKKNSPTWSPAGARLPISASSSAASS